MVVLKIVFGCRTRPAPQSVRAGTYLPRPPLRVSTDTRAALLYMGLEDLCSSFIARERERTQNKVIPRIRRHRELPSSRTVRRG